ncbi:MAG: histidine phosphatase family protein [Duncaniella sp.]|nr:histidine phosphatase family protein [Duncaniella sp.]
MNKLRVLTGILMSAVSVSVLYAQTSSDEIKQNPGKAGGIYYAYPVGDEGRPTTDAPDGYTPFYISHYGRHGSRYLISDNDYRRLRDRLHHARKAGALTPLGLSMAERLDSVWLEAEGRGGELTPLGHRQHRGIARRMITNYPTVFPDTADIFARSTVVMRCAHSMNSFCEGLKEVNPALVIPRESSQRHMYYLNHHTQKANRFTRHGGPTTETTRKFEESQTHPSRVIEAVFSDPQYVYDNVNPHDFMWDVYWVTVDMQNMESPVRFDDVLTPGELFDLWQAFNYRFYTTNCNHPLANGMLLDCAKPLLNNIIECADAAVESGRAGADLRFGHDGNLIPLAALMEIEGCNASEGNAADLYKSYADFKISPMAGNLQMVFFRNDSGDVIVKFMLNEEEKSIPVATDIAPFYHWNDVKDYYRAVIEREDYIPAE